ncbi:MAG: PduL/EutD family phosphate acyltransferase, partial [Gemmatimonadota bacterium]|nr:PduL/EutD family phosphate acyltransferase [Gemmatimonadota bacterium]
VGPARGQTQLELASSDCRALGVSPPVRLSGVLADSGGGITLTGPAGSVALDRGVIVAARHLHLAPEDARRWGLHDGDVVAVRCGEGVRAATLEGVAVRSGAGHATELHLDVDEARATGIVGGGRATVVSWNADANRRRPVITERDVVALARRGAPIPPQAILTPSARDRARSLRLLPE